MKKKKSLLKEIVKSVITYSIIGTGLSYFVAYDVNPTELLKKFLSKIDSFITTSELFINKNRTELEKIIKNTMTKKEAIKNIKKYEQVQKSSIKPKNDLEGRIHSRTEWRKAYNNLKPYEETIKFCAAILPGISARDLAAFYSTETKGRHVDKNGKLIISNETDFGISQITYPAYLDVVRTTKKDKYIAQLFSKKIPSWKEVKDPKNAIPNMKVGAAYFYLKNKKFNNSELAAVAYQDGERRLESKIEKHGKNYHKELSEVSLRHIKRFEYYKRKFKEKGVY